MAEKRGIFIFTNGNEQRGIIKTIAHEISHVVYRSLSENQKYKIAEMARSYGVDGTYGSTSYVYGGEHKRPLINHISGDEWLATCFEKNVLKPELLGKALIKELKLIISEQGVGNDYYPPMKEKSIDHLYDKKITNKTLPLIKTFDD